MTQCEWKCGGMQRGHWICCTKDKGHEGKHSFEE